MRQHLDEQLAERLRGLRLERGWTLNQLATNSRVSRATLSRLENGEVSPTTEVLGKLCTAYGMAMSRLLAMAEESFQPLVPYQSQAVWQDAAAGYTRRQASPPHRALAAELLHCTLEAGTVIAYERPPVPGLEHHLLLLDGQLSVTLDGDEHRLEPGDCLRYRLYGSSRFATPPEQSARYLLVLV